MFISKKLFVMIYHFYKADCYGSSRVLMQSEWEQNSIFVHLPSSVVDGRNYFKRFGWRAVFFSVRKLKSKDVVVFHAQSSLPYLVFAIFIIRFICKKNNHIVYDIHDLHERPIQISLRPYLRYIILRQFEKIVFRLKSIRKITVSGGIAATVASLYRCIAPVVIHNVSSSKVAMLRPLHERSSSCVCFFGTKERVPLSVIPQLAAAGIRLHLYGRDFTRDWLIENVEQQYLSMIEIFGKYMPDELEFLNKYRILILFQDTDKSLNFKYSLPNKLFQALDYGLSVIASKNFETMAKLFQDVGQGVVLADRDDLVDVIQRVNAGRTMGDVYEVRQKLDKIRNEDRNMYINVLNT